MTQVAELHAAVKRGDLPAMRRLLESDPRLANARSETDARGTFALHVAAEAGQAGAARLLLEAGSAPSQRNKHGLTPLGCALGGTQGRWRKFSSATLEDWGRAAEMIRAKGGIE